MNESSDAWKLVVSAGPDQGRVYPMVDQANLVIGRGSDSDTKIRDPRLSRIHCELRRSGGDWILLDRGGAGGTYLDGIRVDSPQVVAHGATLKIGDSQLRLQRDDILDSETIAPETESKPTTPPNAAPAGQVPATRQIAQLEGEIFLRFRLDKLVSDGKNSVIFKGVDTKRDRDVAVKILKPQMTTSEVQRERFIRAMRTMLPVKHPNIVRTRKAGRTGPYCWAAFDWVDGISVAELIDQIGVSGMLDWKEVWRVAVHIGRALEEASKRQIVHRNVTPSNLLRRGLDR
ncbi:MAG: serine/threonine-protein kinase, partial [Pirellulales bacterium]|nr:serine/threonine-protein kinase [Pirellulales bacterium]